MFRLAKNHKCYVPASIVVHTSYYGGLSNHINYVNWQIVSCTLRILYYWVEWMRTPHWCMLLAIANYIFAVNTMNSSIQIYLLLCNGGIISGSLYPAQRNQRCECCQDPCQGTSLGYWLHYAFFFFFHMFLYVSITKVMVWFFVRNISGAWRCYCWHWFTGAEAWRWFNRYYQSWAGIKRWFRR